MNVQHIISINVVIYIGMFIFPTLKTETLLALYNTYDPFFNFLQFLSYLFIHSIHIFLHITFNMLILWIWGIHIHSIFGPLKFIIIYFSSGVIAGLLQNILNILIIYHYTGILDLYKISHARLYISKTQRLNLQYAMYTPIIGASGSIASIVGSFTPINFTIERRKIFIINLLLYNVLILFNIFPSLSHFLHLSGVITGYYISLQYLKNI